MKGKSRQRSGLLRQIRKGQAKRLRKIEQAYDQHAYDGSDPDVGEPLEA